MNTLIIQNPHLQGIPQRITLSSITLVLWMLWIYLLLPALKPLLTFAGIDLSAISIDERGINIEIFIALLSLITTIIVSFWLWIKYNILLHNRHANRKKRQSIIHQNELAHYFKVSPKKLANWHRSERLNIQLTEQGRIHYVKI